MIVYVCSLFLYFGPISRARAHPLFSGGYLYSARPASHSRFVDGSDPVHVVGVGSHIRIGVRGRVASRLKCERRHRPPVGPRASTAPIRVPYACLTCPCIFACFFRLPGKPAFRAVPPTVTAPASPPGTAPPGCRPGPSRTSRSPPRAR